MRQETWDMRLRFSLWQVVGLMCSAFAMGCFVGAISKAHADEVEHPAFGSHQVTQITATAEVDIPKAEAKAVDILRKWDPSLTLAQARAKVRIDGKTDVARCMEYIYINAFDGITQAHVVGVRQENQHPVPAP